MPEHTIAEKKKNLVSKSAAAIAANDATEGSTAPAKPAPKPAKKPKEKIGVGDDAKARREQTGRVVKGLRIKFEKAMTGGNKAKADTLRERIKAVIAAGQ